MNLHKHLQSDFKKISPPTQTLEQSSNNNKEQKVVVFDLDETLGFFSQFSVIWRCIVYVFPPERGFIWNQQQFNRVMDLFPEYVRPYIFDILLYLEDKRTSGQLDKVMIYTNNNAPKKWAIWLSNYLSQKTNTTKFDQVIGAFMVDGIIIEPNRTTHDKTHRDFIRCTSMPVGTQLFFIDDNEHPHMIHSDIYYIQMKPYIHYLSFATIFDRFRAEFTEYEELMHHFSFYLEQYFRAANYLLSPPPKDILETKIDRIVTRGLMKHLRLFFEEKSNDDDTSGGGGGSARAGRRTRRSRNNTFGDLSAAADSAVKAVSESIPSSTAATKSSSSSSSSSSTVAKKQKEHRQPKSRQFPISLVTSTLKKRKKHRKNMTR